jgi:hypothetical protein
VPPQLSQVVVMAALIAGCQRAEPIAHHGKLEMIPAAPSADVEPVVVRELGRARADHKQLLVYVGASWCEPCTRFHDAAARGELDQAFPDLRLLVFDADRDRDALVRAGYTSELIPLFAAPADDGTASGRRIQGGIKGDGAVAQIAPRLRALLLPPR